MFSFHRLRLGGRLFRFYTFLFFILISQCSQRLIDKERMREINAYYDEKVYSLKDDLKISPDDIMKKGTLVRLYVESTPSLLKIKVYPANESRENSTGKLAAYLINEDVKKKKYEFEDVNAWVESKFILADPKNKKTKK
ncbi:MAG: type II secretion system-associated lipoprotein [Leptospira sp.]|jgi:type II secretion system-associated lipoprotein|nr:type II secretion system-associated lipoprotein [Leptospira sp.]